MPDLSIVLQVAQLMAVLGAAALILVRIGRLARSIERTSTVHERHVRS